jgi:hypothetical protein
LQNKSIKQQFDEPTVQISDRVTPSTHLTTDTVGQSRKCPFDINFSRSPLFKWAFRLPRWLAAAGRS